MRYRRDQIKEELIEELTELFGQLPNHSVQRIDLWLMLQSYDATNPTPQKWHRSDLKSMTIKELKALIKRKKGQLVGEYVKQIWK
jgi:ribosomal protein L29